jgi:hypothetical protein
MLASVCDWQKMRSGAAQLSAAELAEAERLERLGKRRRNLLMVLKAERHSREKRAEKMLRLHMEANL